MEDKTHKLWDVIIKCLGFTATAVSIIIGLSQFNSEREDAAELEFNRNFWQHQNALYAEVCRSAGLLAASTREPAVFKKETQSFLSLYYGALVLVEDSTVEKSMRELKSYLEIFDASIEPDPDMENKFKIKVLDLAESCKQSSAIFKRANL